MKSIHFPSEVSPPAADLPVDIGNFLRNGGAGACRHPTIEGALLSSLCTLLGSTGRLENGESGLGGLMAKAYADMTISPSFMLTGSAVPFSLSTKSEGGHYFLHVPRGADASTPVLLLLHGFGGNLLYFPWAIWKEHPDCILIAPSWQINWSEGTFAKRRRYVKAVLAHVEKHIGARLQAPWIVPLSQGGPMAFKLAAALPEQFSGLLGVSTFADNLRLFEKLKSDFPVRLLHGDHDARIPYSQARVTVSMIQQSGGDAEMTTIKGANHFLIISHRKKVGDFLRKHI
jgi:pimeloyl-ACP methyl ester carboxylesterase